MVKDNTIGVLSTATFRFQRINFVANYRKTKILSSAFPQISSAFPQKPKLHLIFLVVIFRVNNADSSRILSLINSMLGISGSSTDCSWACFARVSAHWLPTTENSLQVCWSMWDGIQWIKKVCEWVSDEARCLISWMRKKYLLGMTESHKTTREKALSVKKWISEPW